MLLLLLYIYLFLLFLRINLLIKKNNINVKYICINYVMFVVYIVLNTPWVTNFLLIHLHLHSRFNYLTITTFAFSLYAIVMLEYRLALLIDKTENVISKIAILEGEFNESKKNND